MSSRVDESFISAVARTKADLPPLGLWEDDRYEIQLGWRITGITSGKEATGRRAEVLDLSLNLILALAARDTCGDLPGGTFTPSPQTFTEHPINLLQFRRHAGETWKNMSIGETLGWLAAR